MRSHVQNPVMALPSVGKLAQLSPEAREALRGVLVDMSAEARAKANESWRRHKAPMACYWKAVAVYAGHLARAVGR